MKSARQQTILALLAHHDTLTTASLAAQLGISKETLRRDLTALQAQGKIVRHHGRARVIHTRDHDAGEPFVARLKSHYADKADIARHALAWIE